MLFQFCIRIVCTDILKVDTCAIQKDTPYSELRFKITLNQSTSPSGHIGRFQNMESITTVAVRIPIPLGIPIWNNLKQINSVDLLLNKMHSKITICTYTYCRSVILL